MSWLAVAGIVIGAGGAAMKGNAADKQRNAMKKVSNTPGLDIYGLSREAAANQLESLGMAEQLGSQTALANQRSLMAQEELNLPGFAEARKQMLDKGLSAGLSFLDEDKAFMDGIMRRGAAMGIGRFGAGGAGSQAAQIGTLKLSDTENMARKQFGMGLLSNLLSSLSSTSRIANSPGVQAFLGPDASTVLNIRGNERTQFMNFEAQRAGMPGQTAAWGNYLSSVGGMMTGAGLQGMGGGGAGAGNGTPGYLGSSGGAQYYNVPTTHM